MTARASRPTARARLALPAALAIAAVVATLPARGETFTTFEARSEGCAGGGDSCGSYPIVRTGETDYSHSATSSGTIEVSATVDGGIPTPDCATNPCLPAIGRYHAAAAGTVWVDVATPAGARAVDVVAEYSLIERSATATPSLGSAASDVLGTVSVVPTPGAQPASCSDGSAVTGPATETFDATTATGARAFGVTIRCQGDDATMSAAGWRIGLRVRVSATADGGQAEALARAALLAISVTSA